MASGASSSGSKVVPQFLVKLFQMTNNPAHRDVIAWSDDGAAFWVSDISRVSTLSPLLQRCHLPEGCLQAKSEGETGRRAEKRERRERSKGMRDKRKPGCKL